MNIDNIVPSVLKVTANEIDVTEDLKKDDSNKTISQIIDEQKKEKNQKNTESR
jgi:hypothetical protein